MLVLKLFEDLKHQVTPKRLRLAKHSEDRLDFVNVSDALFKNTSLVDVTVHHVYRCSSLPLILQKYPEARKKPSVIWEKAAMQIQTSVCREAEQGLLEYLWSTIRHDYIEIVGSKTPHDGWVVSV
jgi:hypothetical protein